MSNERPCPAEPTELDAKTIRAQLDSGALGALLDVREPAERAFASIPVPTGAADLFIPLREVSSRLDEIREALARGPMAVYCHHGVRSMAVARWLAAQGLGPIVNLGGGIDAWSVAVDPGVPRYF